MRSAPLHNPPDPGSMVISIHPGRQKPWQALALGIFILAVGGFFQGCWQGCWGIAAVLLLLASLRSFVFPTTYSFNPGTLAIRSLGFVRTIPWSRFKSYRLCPNGIYLSPYVKPKAWEPFRGIFLLLDKDNLSAAKHYIEAELYASNH